MAKPARQPLLILIALLLFACVSSRAEQGALAEYQLRAKGRLESDLEGNYLQAFGGATLSYRGFTLQAESISADRRTGEITARGDVRFSQDGKQGTADSLTYDLNRDRGELSNARFTYGNLILRGARLQLSPDRLLAQNAYFTTCDRPYPDYRIQAEALDLSLKKTQTGYQPDRLKIRRASLWLYHHRLLRLPSHTMNLGQREEAGLLGLPTGGLSSQDGPFLVYRAGFDGPLGARSLLEYRYTTKRGVRGFWRARRPLPWGQLDFLLSRRQDLTDRGISPDELETGLANVLVSQQPELSLHSNERPLGKWFTFRTEFTAGRYREQPTEVKADRISGTVRLYTHHQKFGVFGLREELAFRSSHYRPGDHLNITLGLVTLDTKLGRRATLALSYVRRWPHGTSPFLFDRVEIGTELQPDLIYNFAKDWRVRFRSRQDLRTGRRRDLELQLVRTRHCLEYGLIWRQSRRLVGFRIGLAPGYAPGLAEEPFPSL